MNDIIVTLPFVPLREIAILPGSVTHFDVIRPESIKAVETALLNGGKAFVDAQRDGSREEILRDPSEYYTTGTLILVSQILKLNNGGFRVLLEAEETGKLLNLFDGGDYLRAEVLREPGPLSDYPDKDTEEAMIRNILEGLMEYCSVNQKIGRELSRQIDGSVDLEALMMIAAHTLPFSFRQIQKLLESSSYQEHYQIIQEFLSHETNIIRIKNELQRKVQEQVDKHQKEYVLREQMKVIREELGEDSDSEAEQYEKRLKKLKAPKEVKERIRREIERFRTLFGSNAEINVSQAYIETLLDLPWNKASKDNLDLARARKILEEDHYGLKDVKERILEYLAVRTLTKRGDSPIICLVGPPGTGKTSIARSIARALEKKYVRLGLGGVRDEADIRGHRRTYIGALPGRIADSLRRAGVCNPLILLDEVDKTGSDYKGDVSSALLELLDSEQNCNFHDHYVDIPIDLSQVLFIATANDRSRIPAPLLDRMEIIEVSSYTENEKMHIAKEHLIEKQKDKNGIRSDQLSISDAALTHIIRGYTREAGVRELERKIGAICRKCAAEICEKKKEHISITESNLTRYLGNERYAPEEIEKRDAVGIVCGLAWTSVGGTTLQIETNIMPGEGRVQLTGQLGDVMKESAETGITYIRSIGKAHGIDTDFFAKHDIHIHIPEGAVPKDGPSAGITMATAIYSAVTEEKVRADVAMTGEITLRGRVLPIGGLKEKLLAARSVGIHTVCVPKKNEKDVEQISREITRGLDIRYVSTMDEVLDVAISDE